jgi:hypothetical protein
MAFTYSRSVVSNGELGNMSSASAPLFASLFPERDRSCHLMVHENSDHGTMFKRPLGHREGRQMSDLMTLQNFIDGGYDVVGAKILVVVKSLGQRKKSKSICHAFSTVDTDQIKLSARTVHRSTT